MTIRHSTFLLELKLQRKSRNLTISGLSGGDKRDRTADLLNAIQEVSQLSDISESDVG